MRLCAFTHARLPSHFLLPLVSQIDPLPAASEGADLNVRQLKATLIPADSVSSDDTALVGPMRSYVLKKQHIIEHLSGKRRWAMLVSERMRKWLASKKQKQLHSVDVQKDCLLYTSPSPRDGLLSRMPSSA